MTRVIVLCLVIVFGAFGSAQAQGAPLLPPNQADDLSVLTYLRHDAPVAEAFFSPGGVVMGVGTLAGALVIWQAAPDNDDWQPGAERFRLDGYQAGVSIAAFDPAEAELAATLGAQGRIITRYDLATGDDLGTFEDHAAAVRLITYVDDPDWVLSLDLADELHIWARESGESIATYTDVREVVMDERGTQAALLGPDGTVRWLDFAAPESPQTLDGPPARAAQFSPGGRWLAAWDNTLQVWDTADGAPVLQLPRDRIDRALWSPDGRFLFVRAGGDVQMIAFSMGTEAVNNTGDVLSDFDTGEAEFDLRQFALAPDGARAVTLDRDNVARLWRIDPDGSVRQVRVLATIVDAVRFSPDSQTLIGFRADFGLRFWDAAAGFLRAEVELPDLLIFSPDWRYIASYTGNIVVWYGLPAEDVTFAFEPLGAPFGRSNIRPAPSDDQPRIGLLDSDIGAFAIARSADAAWVEVLLPDGSTGWVLLETIRLRRDITEADILALPVREEDD
ncbi:MAG: hypothetical protein ACLFTK_14870 [Anaerolineales bacterium]